MTLESDIHAIPYIPGTTLDVLGIGAVSATPDGLVLLHWQEIKQLTTLPAGVIVVGYAPLAHPMTRLLGLGVPTVVISAMQAEALQAGQRLMVDGHREVVRDAGEGERVEAVTPPLKSDAPLQTRDGTSIVLRTSVGTLALAQRSVEVGADGIGLARSELFNPEDGSLPDAVFYRQAFGALCEAVAPLPVTVRLIDIAEDKRPSWFGDIPGMQGPLGLKGARLYAREPVRSVLLAQLAAINDLAARYPLSVMLPYIVQPEEFLHWKALLVRHLSVALPIGTMIETPIAALALPEFLQVADFVALGCNDLLQCLFAADRDIVEVGTLLDPYAPFLFRFLRQVSESVSEEVMPRVQVCGLLAQTPGVMPIMLGLGYRCFSVEPALLPHLAHTIRKTDLNEAKELASKVCRAHDSGEVRQHLGMPRHSVWSMGR